ncbi:MAG TPA: helix-turn-helix domain-containing protein [Sphingomicrobium sp.]|nr:helix-turn-helix domain-containing protein [Sphingomicrobium sp.]
MMDHPYLLSISETADALSIGRSKTYDLINEGKLLTVTIGRRRLVRADSVEALARGEAA